MNVIVGSSVVKKILATLGNRRTAAVFFMGFSSGIPLALTGSTLQAWMKTEGVDLSVIGLFSLVGLPYALKFLWAPFMDRFVPPILGRRRGWILVTQMCLLVAIIAMAFSNPVIHPWFTAAVAVGVSFFSASQDIVVDAYKTELLTPAERGVGVAASTFGYRMAMIVSGAVALILSDHLSWKQVYFVMAATMGIGIVTSFLSPEPNIVAGTPRSIRDAVVMPLFEFFKRRGAWEILLFVVLYKLDTVIATAMTTPFMQEMGFTKTDIGTVTKGFGLVATIAGTAFGGAMMIRLGMLRSLWLFGILQGIAALSFMVLASLGHHYPMMVTSIALENFFSGTGTAAYSAFLMSICDRRYTATQYALLSSLMALTRQVGAAPSGFLVKSFGWHQYFVFSILASIPGLLLLTRFKRWGGVDSQSGST